MSNTKHIHKFSLVPHSLWLSVHGSTYIYFIFLIPYEESLLTLPRHAVTGESDKIKKDGAPNDTQPGRSDVVASSIKTRTNCVASSCRCSCSLQLDGSISTVHTQLSSFPTGLTTGWTTRDSIPVSFHNIHNGPDNMTDRETK